MADELIKIGVSGFAECATSNPKSLPNKLRPYKFKSKGEGAGRSGYYQFALNTIRLYHKSERDPKIFEKAINELLAKSQTEPDKLRRIKYKSNAAAIVAYHKIYGNRRFKVLPNHRLRYRIGSIVVTAQPDLWVEEDGTQVLIKVGVNKKKAMRIDVLLYVMRKAAIATGYRVRARNVVYLDVTNGQERCCNNHLSRYNRMFVGLARQIAKVWPTIGENNENQ